MNAQVKYMVKYRSNILDSWQKLDAVMLREFYWTMFVHNRIVGKYMNPRILYTEIRDYILFGQYSQKAD